MNQIQTKWLRDYTNEIKQAIPEINKTKNVVDDSQLKEFLGKVKNDESYVLVSVLPNFNPVGDTPDDVKLNLVTQFMVLSKNNYSRMNEEDMNEMWDNTFSVAKSIILKMFNDSLHNHCMLRYLKVNSIQCVPVWNKSSCDGWNIRFNFPVPF